jgi:hypothetical protein
MRAVLVALVLFVAPALRANGVAGADVLSTHPSARAAALGNAFVALGDDLGALSFNPAGLAALKTPSLGFLHHVGVATVSTEHVAYAHPLSFGVLGGALLYRSQADIANPLPGQEEKNAAFVTDHNYGRLVAEVHELPDLISKILSEPHFLNTPPDLPNPNETILSAQ